MKEFIDVVNMLIPVAGLIALILLIVLLINLNKAIAKLPDSVGRVDAILDEVGTSVKKAQVPLEAAGNVSKTVDDVNSVVTGVVRFSANQFVKQYGVVKDMLVAYLSKDKTKPAEKADSNHE